MSFGSFDTLNASTDRPKVTTKDVIREDMSDEVKRQILRRKEEEQARIDNAHKNHLRQKKQEVQSQLDRDKVKTELQEKLLQWSGDVNKGTLKNIRALLTTMDTVLWEGSGWKPLTLADCVQASKIKIKYYSHTNGPPDRSAKVRSQNRSTFQNKFSLR